MILVYYGLMMSKEEQMGISVHALPPEAFWNELDLEAFVDSAVSEMDERCIVSVLPVEEIRLANLEGLFRRKGVKVKRILLKLASEMDQSRIELTRNIVYVCECYDEIRSAQAGARIAAGIPGSTLMLWRPSDFLRTVDSSVDPDAEVIPVLNYGDALEMFYFLDKPEMAESIRSAMQSSLPIRVRCLRKASHPGTLIAPAKALKPFYGVKCICAMKGLTLISVDKIDSNVAQLIFSTLKNAGIRFQLLARAGGDDSITFSVRDSQASACRLAIKGLFPSYQASFLVKSQTNISIVTALGEGMAKMSGMCGKFFGALGAAQVSIKAFAQGLYEKSICAAIDTSQLILAQKSLNCTFFGEGPLDELPEINNCKELFLGLFGKGNVGSLLIERIAKFNRNEDERNIVVFYIADSKRFLADLGGIDLDTWRDRFEKEAIPKNPQLLMHGLADMRQRHQVAMVDCTGSDEVPLLYPGLMESGVNVVVGNKLGVCIEQDIFDKLLSDAEFHNTQFEFEATVGAGLPIIRTIRNMVSSGERINMIQAVLSGTLSWVFSNLSPQRKFSDLVIDAMRRGYCDPNPMNDLSGLDSGRKAIILSHVICPGQSMNDVKISSVIPPSMENRTIDEILLELSSLDEEMERLRLEAEQRGEVLRYVGSIHHSGAVSCGLESVSGTSPIAMGQAGDCCFVVYSEHYPAGLCLVGDGAGPGAICNALMADICSVME